MENMQLDGNRHTVQVSPKVRVVLDIDDDPQAPEQYPCVDHFLVGAHRQFSVEVEGFCGTEEHFEESWKDTHEIYPLSAYIHSGVHLYLGTHKLCQFDSGQVGWVCVPKAYDDSEGTYAKSIVEEWNSYLSGDVWAIHVETRDEDSPEWDAAFDPYPDSLFNIYDMEHALEEFESIVKHVREDLVKYSI